MQGTKGTPARLIHLLTSRALRRVLERGMMDLERGIEISRLHMAEFDGMLPVATNGVRGSSGSFRTYGIILEPARSYRYLISLPLLLDLVLWSSSCVSRRGTQPFGD